MGKIRAPHGYFLDLASEEVACSSGVLLTDNNIKTLSVRYDIDEFRYLERSDRETVMRPEDFEDAVLNVRKAIGNLPDTKMGQLFVWDAARALHDEGGDVIKVAEAYLAISESGKYSNLGMEAIEEIITTSGQSPSHVLKFMDAVGEMQRRRMNFLYGRVRQKNWDGAVPLDRLFQGEHIPHEPAVYLDQRYIDYLAKNSEEMGRIHWRNFERLTTEFFRRQGYEVDLGTGTKDDGKGCSRQLPCCPRNSGARLAAPAVSKGRQIRVGKCFISSRISLPSELHQRIWFGTGAARARP